MSAGAKLACCWARLWLPMFPWGLCSLQPNYWDYWDLAPDSEKPKALCVARKAGRGPWRCWVPHCWWWGSLADVRSGSPRILRVFLGAGLLGTQQGTDNQLLSILKCKLTWAVPEGTILIADLRCTAGRDCGDCFTFYMRQAQKTSL